MDNLRRCDEYVDVQLPYSVRTPTVAFETPPDNLSLGGKKLYQPGPACLQAFARVRSHTMSLTPARRESKHDLAPSRANKGARSSFRKYNSHVLHLETQIKGEAHWIILSIVSAHLLLRPSLTAALSSVSRSWHSAVGLCDDLT